MKLQVAVLIALAFAASGCASHTWVPGPDAKGTFEEAKAQCSLIARHSGGEYYAQGTPSFVAGAAVGAAIGNAIRAQADLNDCLSARGWVVADATSGGNTGASAASSQVASIRDQLNACITAVRDIPKYAPLTPHLISNAVGHYTLTQMSDGRVPSAEEASLLASYGDETDVCRARSIAQISAMDPRIGQTILRMNMQVRDLDLALINRRITWGDYAREAQEVADSAGQTSVTAAAAAQLRAPQSETATKAPELVQDAAKTTAAPAVTPATFARPAQTQPALAAPPPVTAAAPPPAMPTLGPAVNAPVRKLSLGIMTSTVTRESVPSVSMADPHGAVVTAVATNSAGDRAGLKYGDIIQTFNNHRVSGMEELDQYLSETAPGIPLTLGVWRRGQLIVIQFIQ